MDATPPIILVVSSEASVVRALEADLGRRFGNDTRIVGADGPAAGMAQLEALADGAQPVALLIADQRMAETTGGIGGHVHDVVSAEACDLWIGDEAWEVDYFLHETPS